MARTDALRDTTREAWSITPFDDRYGVGAQDRLLTMLRQPCHTFARIAQEFGVTRECVRQWHKRLLPDDPAGHERQRQCRQIRHRKRLSKDPLIIGFHRRIPAQLPHARLTLLAVARRLPLPQRAAERSGVGLTRAAWLEPADAGAGFVLTYAAWTVDYVYCELGDADFLFLPREALPRRTTRLDEAASLHLYRNTFRALEAEMAPSSGQSEE